MTILQEYTIFIGGRLTRVDGSSLNYLNLGSKGYCTIR